MLQVSVTAQVMLHLHVISESGRKGMNIRLFPFVCICVIIGNSQLPHMNGTNSRLQSKKEALKNAVLSPERLDMLISGLLSCKPCVGVNYPPILLNYTVAKIFIATHHCCLPLYRLFKGNMKNL